MNFETTANISFESVLAYFVKTKIGASIKLGYPFILEHTFVNKTEFIKLTN